MNTHFSTFTADGMRAFRARLAEDFSARAEFLNNTRHDTSAMLAGFRQQHVEREKERRFNATQEAEARRRFAGELRAGVQALRHRFELARQEAAEALREMAGECRAAREAFRNHPGHAVESFLKPPKEPKVADPAPEAEEHPFHAPAKTSHEGKTKKRH